VTEVEPVGATEEGLAEVTEVGLGYVTESGPVEATEEGLGLGEAREYAGLQLQLCDAPEYRVWRGKQTDRWWRT
jgi:hypothetical protein